MKTKTTYPERANKAKAFFVAVLICIQASLIASDSSEVIQGSDCTNEAFAVGAKFSVSLTTGIAYDFMYEEADEPEMEIEKWMSNIQNDSFNSQLGEEEIALEEWMCNTHHSFWFYLSEAEESELAIESWMTNPNDWVNTNDDLMLTSK